MLCGCQLSVVSESSDGRCELRSEVNNASVFLSAGLPDVAPAAAASSCGSEVGRAWTVSVNVGQFINFTLIDLSPSQSRLHSCRVYAALSERGAERAVSLCTGAHQHNVTYTSTSHVVNVTLYHQLSRRVNYLLKYEGDAITAALLVTDRQIVSVSSTVYADQLSLALVITSSCSNDSIGLHRNRHRDQSVYLLHSPGGANQCNQYNVIQMPSRICLKTTPSPTDCLRHSIISSRLESSRQPHVAVKCWPLG